MSWNRRKPQSPFAPPAAEPRPPSTIRPVIFQPAVRLVAIISEAGIALDAQDDPDKFDVYTQICPVIAVQCEGGTGEGDGIGPDYDAVIVIDGDIRCCYDYAWNGSVHSIEICPWPAEEDEIRLKETIEGLESHLRFKVERMIRDGDRPFTTEATERADAERKAAEKQKNQKRKKSSGGDQDPPESDPEKPNGRPRKPK